MERVSCLTGMENLFFKYLKYGVLDAPNADATDLKMQPHCIEVEKKKKDCLAATHRASSAPPLN